MEKIIKELIRKIESIQDLIHFNNIDRTEEGEKAYQELDSAKGWLMEVKLKKVI